MCPPAPPPESLTLEGRVDRALRTLWRPAHGPQLPALCRDLDLVVELQRCAQNEPGRLNALASLHRSTLALWLFGVALGCVGLGLHDEAKGLLSAVPGIDAGGEGRACLLADIIEWQSARAQPLDEEDHTCTAA